MADDGARPLDRLATEGAIDFPNLMSARQRTTAGLETKRPRLAKLQHDSDAAVVLMGSWGRAEVTAGSDDDFMVLVNGPVRDNVEPTIDAVKTVLDRAPGDQGIFAKPVS